PNPDDDDGGHVRRVAADAGYGCGLRAAPSSRFRYCWWACFEPVAHLVHHAGHLSDVREHRSKAWFGPTTSPGRREPLMSSLPAIFTQRPVATALLTIGIAFAGALAFGKLPVSPLPQIDFPTISVLATM